MIDIGRRDLATAVLVSAALHAAAVVAWRQPRPISMPGRSAPLVFRMAEPAAPAPPESEAPTHTALPRPETPTPDRTPEAKPSTPDPTARPTEPAPPAKAVARKKTAIAEPPTTSEAVKAPNRTTEVARPSPPPVARSTAEAAAEANDRASAASVASMPAAPAVGISTDPAETTTEHRYAAQLYAWLERHKDYPITAQRRREEGTGAVRLKLARDGRVLEHELVASTGSRLLDEAILAAVRRSDPFPAAPDAYKKDTVETTIPIQFRRR